jgi:hypothetical protein
MPLKNTTLTLQLTGGHTNTAGAIPLAYVLNGTFELPATMTDGTGSNKAQTSAKVSDSVANGAPDTVDLTAVSRSPLANAVFSKLKIGIIVNKETDDREEHPAQARRLQRVRLVCDRSVRRGEDPSLSFLYFRAQPCRRRDGRRHAQEHPDLLRLRDVRLRALACR